VLSGATAAKRPNILWITSEDNAWHFVRLFDPVHGAPMPNLERLGNEGLIFDRAFANAPVCSVARSAIISGCYGPRTLTQYHRRSRFAPMPDGLHMYPWYLRQAGYFTSNNAKTDYNFVDADTWDECSPRASWRHRRPGQPFFHIQNFGTTHEGRLHFSAEEMATTPNQTPSDAVTLFPFHPDTPTFRYTYARYHDLHRRLDEQIGELLAQLEADGLMDDTIIFYYGDHGGVVPGTKGYLHETGLHVPLLVWFPEKWRHLAPAGAEPGTRLRGFVSFVDLAPTLLNLAGIPIPDGLDGSPFLGPGVSLCDLEQRDEVFAYADRFDEKYDLVRSLRKGRFRYIRNFQPFNFDGLQNNYRYRMLAWQEWRELYQAGRLDAAQRRFFEPRPPEELYDIETDPFQLHNLADNPAFRPTLLRLRARLGDRLRSMPDLSFLPENILLKEAIANPVAWGRDHRAEIARLIDIADLQLVPFADAEPSLRAALASSVPWERYWALIVCTTHGRAAEPLLPIVRRIAADDPVNLVRVLAAECLALVAGEDTREPLTAAVRQAADPVELNLILNTVVLLRDGPPHLRFPIDPTWFPAAWLADRDNEFLRRLEYLVPGFAPPAH